MVNVGDKLITQRTAVARGRVTMATHTVQSIMEQVSGQETKLKKGAVLGVAQIAGIMAAKRTSNLIPLCHPLPIDSVEIELCPDPKSKSVQITSTVTTSARTGVEMEALTAVSVAALTLYDMCKSLDKTMRIEGVHLLSKIGGVSGDYHAIN